MRSISLLQRLSNVEYLTLLLAIGRKNTIPNHFIDRSMLERDILVYMSRLRQFLFHIRSILRNASRITIRQIRQSFVKKQQQEQAFGCVLDHVKNNFGQSQIHSLPFIGTRLDFISNRFPLFDINITFINVTMLLLFDDIKSFENVFLERVTQALPRLRTLDISNQLEQEEKKTTTNSIELSHLSTLILHKIHMDYGEQLLCRSHLPYLVELVIRNDVLLTIIDQDNQQAKNNCSNVETLFIVEPWIELTSVHLKFFPKLYMKNL
jgi:hypothetical protein